MIAIFCMQYSEFGCSRAGEWRSIRRYRSKAIDDIQMTKRVIDFQRRERDAEAFQSLMLRQPWNSSAFQWSCRCASHVASQVPFIALRRFQIDFQRSVFLREVERY